MLLAAKHGLMAPFLSPPLCSEQSFFNLVLAMYSCATQTWQFGVKCSILGTAGHCWQGKGCAPLQTRRLSSEQVVIQRQLVKNNRHHNQIYIYIYSTCACSLNVKFITSCCCYLSLQQMFFLASQKCDCNWWGVWLHVFVLFFPILNIV